MHQPIRENLENYLRDPRDRAIPQDFRTHLANCVSCASEVETLGRQSLDLRLLRDTEQPDLQADFYARVLERIDAERESATGSFWYPFMAPAFGRRLAIACGALVVALGTYLVSTERTPDFSTPSEAVIQRTTIQNTGGDVRPQDRDAVLVQLASYHE